MKIFSAPNRSQSSPVFGVIPWSASASKVSNGKNAYTRTESSPRSARLWKIWAFEKLRSRKTGGIVSSVTAGSRAMSWIDVMPTALSCAITPLAPTSFCSSEIGLTNRCRNSPACPYTIPVSSPDASRPNRPPRGSGVRRSIRATSKAFEFAKY